MINLSLIYPAPCRWPSVIRYRLNPFGFTNGSSVGLIRKSVTEAYILGGLPFEKKYLQRCNAHMQGLSRRILERQVWGNSCPTFPVGSSTARRRFRTFPPLPRKGEVRTQS